MGALLGALSAIPGIGKLFEALGKALGYGATYVVARRQQAQADELRDTQANLDAVERSRRAQEELRRLPVDDRERVRRRYSDSGRP